MATEQSTMVVYPLDGNNRRFYIPFEYLSRQFVEVTLMGTARTPLVLGSDFRFISLTEIETTRAWSFADGFANIELRRVTSATDRLVEFSDGSVLRSRDMNVSAIQTIHIAEEARNLASDTLAENDDGNLDARGRRLVNLADAISVEDAVSFGQVQTWSASAFSQANRAEREASAALVSQQASKVSETNSKTSETKAKTSEQAALASQNASKTSETKAKTSEQAALASQNASKTSETKAKTSETNSKTSETNSKTSETFANKWADNPEDIPVVAGKFSAKHWSEKAKGFVSGSSYLAKAENLGDVPDKSIARQSLGLGEAATRDATGTGALMNEGYLGWGGSLEAPATLSYTIKGGFVSVADMDTSSFLNWGAALTIPYHTGRHSFQIGAYTIDNPRPDIVFRTCVSTGAYPSGRLLTTFNTTTDPNGFIKTASPVLEVYDDRVSMGSGYDIRPSLERIEVGTYVLKDTTGLRVDDGWYIETPTNRNGDKYYNIEWHQSSFPVTDKGVIKDVPNFTPPLLTLRIYTRVWDSTAGTFTNGVLVDMAEKTDRPVMLRLNEFPEKTYKGV